MFLGGLLIGGADETLAALGDGSFQAALEGGGVGPALPAHLREEVDRALQHTPKARTACVFVTPSSRRPATRAPSRRHPGALRVATGLKPVGSGYLADGGFP